MKAYSGAAGTQGRHRGPTVGPLALRNVIAGLQRSRWHSGTPSRAYNDTAGTQERHRGPTAGPLALRNAIAGLQRGRWHSGTPFPGQNGAAGAQECHSRDGMGSLAWPLMLNNKKLMSRYSRLLKKIRVFVAGL